MDDGDVRMTTQVAWVLEQCRQRLAASTDKELPKRFAAIERDPSNPLGIYKLARALRQRGQLDLWRCAIDIALALPHLTHEHLWYRAHAKLRLDDWSGWVDRESRLFEPGAVESRPAYFQNVQWTTQLWHGEDLREKTIFVIADGGFGDCLQMLRFVPGIVRSARSVILGVKSQLISFVQHNFGEHVVVTPSRLEHGQTFQYYTWAMSLASMCPGLPPFTPMTAPSPISRSNRDRHHYDIGVCWAGDPAHFSDHRRSIPIDVLAPLFSRRDVHWHSLQVGDRAADAVPYPSIASQSEPLRSFADTANLMSRLDCVVTVDTAVAHLAGTLGVPTFLLLNYLSEFRWGMGDTTPWYPSMRLIRQRTPGDWASVIEAVAAALDTRSATKRPATTLPWPPQSHT